MDDLKFREYPLPKGQSLFHLYTAKYGPTGFNDSESAFRFSPIVLDKGAFLPTYYAAINCNDAMAETVIRRYRHKPTLTWHMNSETQEQIDAGNAKAIAQVSPKRDLNLIDLETLSDHRGVNPIAHELKLGTVAYKTLRFTAKYLYDNYTGYDGLTWDGYQMRQPGNRCMMFFGDTVTPEVLQEDWSGLMRERQNLFRLYDALRATKCDIPEWLKNEIDQ